MKQTTLKVGVVVASTLFAAAVHAHEPHFFDCSYLDQPDFPPGDTSTIPEDGCYGADMGFKYEDGFRPTAGEPNNTDFFPYFIDKDGTFFGLNRKKGDKVDVKATLTLLDDIDYDVGPALDDDGKVKFKRTYHWLQMEITDEGGEDFPAYRGKRDLITPYNGSYSWVIKGTLQRMGQRPIKIHTKYTCGWGSLSNPHGAILYGFAPTNDQGLNFVLETGVVRNDPSTWIDPATGFAKWPIFDCAADRSKSTSARAATSGSRPDRRLLPERVEAARKALP